MDDSFDGDQDVVGSRVVAGWIHASRAGCRMLVEEPALATAVTVAWSLADACQEEREQAVALARRLGEEYCLRATVTAHDSHFSVRFVRDDQSESMMKISDEGSRSVDLGLGDVRHADSARPTGRSGYEDA